MTRITDRAIQFIEDGSPQAVKSVHGTELNRNPDIVLFIKISDV
jgi:hypothetical protein